MPPRHLNPNAKPFFHFPSKTYFKPLNPNAETFQIQTYFCNPSWQWRPFVPKDHYKVTTQRPSVITFLQAMNRNIPVSCRKQHSFPCPSKDRKRHAWKPKLEEHKDQSNKKSLEKKRNSKGNVITFPSRSANQKSSCTTVMIKNIPNQFRRTDLVAILRRHCFEENKKSEYKSEFDFVYLPMDFQKYWEDKRVANLGYAFVNFTSPVAALRFFRYYNNREWNVRVNNKICQITSAKIQGKEALLRQFENSVFWCHSDMYLPAVLEPACDGEYLPELINVGFRVCAPSRNPRRKAV
ncbi:protein terminal ear1 homolog [Argentina anserina]|uniref:protein terminal ear1 homolog n=1 Tax=Argentina anserina TaxID=57926 RepID=UPI0021764EC0|nr:protein terminal ear1 homolog [Potentilla anserina]